MDDRCAGLAVPHVATDVLAMAATAVGRWAAGATGPARVAGDILLAERAGVDVYLTPARRDAPVGGFTVADTMWKSGRQWCAESTAIRST